MAKRLVHDFMLIPSSAVARRIFIDGISARLVLFGSVTVPSVNVYFDSALAVMNGNESNTVYDWPLVRDRNNAPILYDTYIDLSNDVGTGDPIGMLMQVREVERP